MKKFVITFLFIILSLFIPGAVSAHILQKDGSIGAVLHIDPEDDPIAGIPATMFWEITDRRPFIFEDCNCTVQVLENGRKITEEQLPSPYFTYTFPEKNVYQVHLIGFPKQGTSFQPFSLSYDIRVSREAPKQTQGSVRSPIIP